MATATASATKLRPLGDRVVVKPTAREEMTKSGIVLPDTAKEKPQEGRSSPSARAASSTTASAVDGRQGRRQGPVRQVRRHRVQARDEDDLLILARRTSWPIVEA